VGGAQLTSALKPVTLCTVVGGGTEPGTTERETGRSTVSRETVESTNNVDRDEKRDTEM